MKGVLLEQCFSHSILFNQKYRKMGLIFSIYWSCSKLVFGRGRPCLLQHQWRWHVRAKRDGDNQGKAQVRVICKILFARGGMQDDEKCI